VVFKNEVELLRKNGVEVVTYERYNDDIKDYVASFFFLLQTSGQKELTMRLRN